MSAELMIAINGNNLSLAEVSSVADMGSRVELDEKAREGVEAASQWVAAIVERGKPVYGINTGFGVFSNRTIDKADIQALNRNLIISHAVGTGPALPNNVVRAAMLIRANTLANGNSGNRVQILDTLIAMLNQGVTPIIPSQGSLGSSGDLAPLAQLALTLSKDEEDQEAESGMALIGERELSGKAAMAEVGIERPSLGAKEGLAITNGATFSAAIAALALTRSTRLIELSEMALAMSLEALRGRSAAFDKRIHNARGHSGQIAVAAAIRNLIAGSTLIDSGEQVQDAYSLRAAPQVQGPVRECIENVGEIILREINASTDNPLIFGEAESISGANFHGQPVAQAMDFLKISLSELGAVAERRIFLLTDGNANFGLPAMLVANEEAAGLNSGVMMLQYTAASLALENQSLASPDSVLSLPSSGGKEDHNANAMTAARHAAQILSNVEHIVATELYVAARALDLRLMESSKLRPGDAVAAALQAIRAVVPFQGNDALWGPELEELKEKALAGQILVD
jgi:histidine ammonia-lyase